MIFPSARTWAKSRTRRSSRLAIRGVPRDRRAISAAPSSAEVGPEQPGRSAHDVLQVGGVVEVELGGEAEPVAQRSGQQPGPGGRADQGELRDLQRDGGRTRALADDDVDPEVLHRQVEHLLGRPRHPVDLVEEEHLALGSARTGSRPDPRRAGWPDRWRSAAGPTSRAAMIIARVVLPSPGGPDSSTWSGTAAAVPGGLEHQTQLVTDPRLALELGQGGRAQRRLGRPFVGVGVGTDQRRQLLVGQTRIAHRPAPSRGPGSAGRPASARRHRRPGSSRPGARPRRRRPRRPGRTSRDPAGPELTWSRQPAAPVAGGPRTGSSARPTRVDLVLELDHQPLGALAADARAPCTAGPGSRWRSRARSSSGVSTASAA